MIANADNVIRYELSLYDGDDFVTGATVPGSIRRLSDGKFLVSGTTWQMAYVTTNLTELTGNDGVEGRYFLNLAVQASPDIYMFRALFTFEGEANADVWETQTDAEAFRLTAARAAVLTDWIDGGRLDLLLDLIPTTVMRGTNNAATAVALTTVDTEVGLIQNDLNNVTDGLGALKALLDAIPTTMVGTDNASTHDAAAVVTAMMAQNTDGVSLTDILTAGMAVLLGVAVPSGDDVLFKKRDGTTTKVTQTYGSDDGERTGSVIT